MIQWDSGRSGSGWVQWSGIWVSSGVGVEEMDFISEARARIIGCTGLGASVLDMRFDSKGSWLGDFLLYFCILDSRRWCPSSSSSKLLSEIICRANGAGFS